MKIGDLVIMPCEYSREAGNKAEIGVVIKMKDYSDPRNTRVCVYWFDYQEQAWEPKKWLEVINESR